jgi:(E)-4-hydroxy-3-methyl-but-2-enyl pyrophosphate reductase
MNIKLAKYAGFCMGVRRAIDLCIKSLSDKKKPIYAFGPIIHNNTVINELQSSGVKIIENVDDLKEGDYVLLRTHGIDSSLRKKLIEKKVNVIDATCPKVARVQAIIKEHVKKGGFVLIIGDKGHAETKALVSYADEKAKVISKEDDLKTFIRNNKGLKNICVVAQTTQSLEFFEKICKQIKENFKSLKIVNTICDTTRKRQDELIEKAKGSDSVFIVGGKHSANTTRLFDIGSKLCDKIFHIETEKEIEKKDLPKKGDNVFITAGASTPFWIVEDVFKKIKNKNFLSYLINILSNKFFMFFMLLISILSIFKNFFNIVPLLGFLFINRAIYLKHFKSIDVFRFDYLYINYFFILGFLLIFITLFYNLGILLMLLYYGVFLYFVYKNKLTRDQVLSLISLSFFWFLF